VSTVNEYWLVQAITTARRLSEPGEVNEEYVRGQVNLITDLHLPGFSERYYSLLTAAITHQLDLPEAVNRILEAAQAAEEEEAR
jgi:hypothetical protein